MTNSTKTTKYSSIFLAAILVAGTITSFFPSFMVGTAQAAPYPDMDREKNADKKSVSVQSLKCNNINVNVNGLELDVFPPFLGGEVAATAAEDNSDGNSFAGNGGANDGSQINDFRFICINNNNNTVVQEQAPEPPTCDDCFLSTADGGPIPPDRLTMLNNHLSENAISVGEAVEVWGNVQGYCDAIEEQNAAGTPASEFQIRTTLAFAFETSEDDPIIEEIIDCLLSLGLITPSL